MRLKIVFALFSTSVLFGVFIIGHHRNIATNSTLKFVESALPALAHRIKSDIVKLEGESPSQSRAKLSDVNMFYLPGPRPPEVAYPHGWLPLDPAEDQVDVDAILSNRRVRKVFDDLSKLNKLEAAKLVNEELIMFLPIYSSLYAGEIDKWMPKARDQAGMILITADGSTQSLSANFQADVALDWTPVFAIGNVPESETVISGARLKVLALVWMAGVLELNDTHDQVIRVAETALQQQSELYTNYTITSANSFISAQVLKRASLCNRRIIASALLGTSRKKEENMNLMSRVGAKWVDRRWASYRAALTEFDPPVRSGIMQPDYANGSVTVRIISPLGDNEFDDIIKGFGLAQNESSHFK